MNINSRRIISKRRDIYGLRKFNNVGKFIRRKLLSVKLKDFDCFNFICSINERIITLWVPQKNIGECNAWYRSEIDCIQRKILNILYL